MACLDLLRPQYTQLYQDKMFQAEALRCLKAPREALLLPLLPAPSMAQPSLVACQEQPLLFDWKSCFLSRRGASPRDTLSVTSPVTRL